MTDFKINLTQIESLRITCKHCDTALILPLKARNIPSECVNCEGELPSKETKELLAKLRFLKSQLQDNNAMIELHFEGELL